MDILHIVLIFLILLDTKTDCTCVYSKGGRELTIKHIDSITDFKVKNKNCGSGRVQKLRYEDCDIDYMYFELHAFKNFPNVESVVWMCDGKCGYDSEIDIKINADCKEGNLFFNFSSR